MGARLASPWRPGSPFRVAVLLGILTEAVALVACHSGTRGIARASNVAREHSRAVASEIASAAGPGVVTDAANLIIEDQDAIIAHATPTVQAADAINLALPTVKDAESQWVTFIRYAVILAIAVAAMVGLFY